MKLNKQNIIIAVIILVLLVLLFLKQCGTSSVETSIPQDTTPTSQQQDTTKHKKTDTLIKILNVTKNIRDTFVKKEILIQRDTIIDNKNLLVTDSLQNLLLMTNKEYQTKIQNEQVYIQEINSLRAIQKQKEDSIKMLLVLLQKERTSAVLENKQDVRKMPNKEIFLFPKNIVFIGFFTDTKGTEQETIYGGLLKQVSLSMDFISTIAVKQDNRKQTVYIRISDLQTDQLIYITEEKPKEPYELEDGEKINYSLQSQITLNQNNIANLKITHPMKWTLKRNSAIKVEVFYNKQKIGEQINEIKSGIPVTTW